MSAKVSAEEGRECWKGRVRRRGWVSAEGVRLKGGSAKGAVSAEEGVSAEGGGKSAEKGEC